MPGFCGLSVKLLLPSFLFAALPHQRLMLSVLVGPRVGKNNSQAPTSQGKLDESSG